MATADDNVCKHFHVLEHHCSLRMECETPQSWHVVSACNQLMQTLTEE